MLTILDLYLFILYNSKPSAYDLRWKSWRIINIWTCINYHYCQIYSLDWWYLFLCTVC